MDGEQIKCNLSGEEVVCNGTTYVIPEHMLTYNDTMFWVYLGVYVALVLFAGLMSGLTLGLLSLDTTSLRVLQEAGTPSQRKHATRILPLVKRHHMLLVTLLFANAVAVETMPICLDRISDPIIAVVVSVTAVLFFGEVFPQALCSRFGLAIGATLSPLVYFLMALFFIVTFPLAKLLDCMLGKEHGTFFRRAELKALVDLHGPDQTSVVHEKLSRDEVLIIKGALEMRDKTTKDALVPLESVYMISADACMDEKTMTEIIKASHSRLPVYEGARTNILGMLLIKTLVLLDPKEATPVRSLLGDQRVFRRLRHVPSNMPLYDLLNDFQKGKAHLSVVRQATGSSRDLREGDESNGSGQATLGIITLEDVIEELLQEEIVDETDVYVDVHRRVKVAQAWVNVLRTISRETSRVSYPTSNSDVEQVSSEGGRLHPDSSRRRPAYNTQPSDSDPLLP